MQTPLLKIGTRSSKLAIKQACAVRDALVTLHDIPPRDIEIVPMSTKADRILDRPLSLIGGKGLFTQEIEQALQEGRLDMAVHSTKDMPTCLPDGLHLAAFLAREDPRDAFIGRQATSIAALEKGAIIGTSSLRRQAFIRHYRPDLRIVPFRGNVETRLEKLQRGEADGTFLAVAGLKRLECAHVITEILPQDIMLPTPGQGAIAIEGRMDDEKTVSLLATIGSKDTYDALSCERAFLSALDGSCRTPLGGLAHIKEGKIIFNGAIATPDGKIVHRVTWEGARHDGAHIGSQAAHYLRKQAGADFFTSWI